MTSAIRSSLGIGLTLLLGIGVVMSGIAIAHSGESGAELEATRLAATSPVSTRLTLNETDRLGPDRRHGNRAGRDTFRVVAEVLGVDAATLYDLVRETGTVAGAAQSAGTEVKDVIASLTDHANDRLDAALVDGRIDDARADVLRDEITDRVTDFVEADHRDRLDVRRDTQRQRLVQRAAEVLGLTPEALRVEFESAGDLAGVVEMHGLTVDEFVAEFLAPAKERLDGAVAEGKIDADVAAQRLAEMTQRITSRLTG